MLIINAQSDQEDLKFQGGSQIIAVKVNTGQVDIKIKQNEGVYLTADTYSQDTVTRYFFGKGEYKIECTNDAEITIYGGER